MSRVLVTSSVGGIRCRSEKIGESTGFLRSVLPTYASSGKSVEREQLPGVARLAEVRKTGKYAKSGGQWHPQLLQPSRHFIGENRSRGCAEDSNVLRLTGLQHFPVDRDHILDGGRKRILGRKAVVDRNHFDLCQVCDRNALDQRTGIRI